MKQRKLIARNRSQSRSLKTTTKKSTLLLITALIILGAISPVFSNSSVMAVDKYDQKIDVIEDKINSYNERAKELSEQSDSLSKAIAILDNEKSQLQAEIDLNNAKVESLKAQIAENETKIKDQGYSLSEIMADMHFDQQTSPIEMLASSNNLSDYVDKQSRQASVQDQLKASIKQINDLKSELQKQKEDSESILKDQVSRRSVLASKQQQQQDLLDKTKGQEATYANLTAESKKQIAQLQAEQAAANARVGIGKGAVAGDPNRGGYPSYLHNAAKDSLVDPWGMYNRECVSYTAWKVYQAYGNMPYWGGRGNANQWVSNANRAGIPTGSTPKVGSVGAYSGGRWGHVVWIEKVSEDKSMVYISQYNTGGNGLYSEQWIKASTYTYIYFGDR